MNRRRFYAPPEAFATDGASVVFGREEARHLRDVLRLGRGQEVFVFDGGGREFRCRVDESGRDRAVLGVVGEVEPARPESPLQLTLGVALLKGEKLDLVVQKATELGVRRVVPIVTRRADVRLRGEDEASRRVERLRRIALEACKQSGRARVPVIDAPAAYESFVSVAPSNAAEWRALFAERSGTNLAGAVEGLRERPDSVTALVGSEGGWTDEEIELARDSGWSVVTLGGRILRAETAAIAITALLQHAFGDLT
ncbi:MAG TPA: 16S rRNA (uracil(1498)-N(3))-methyltransferase [Pyrinomonadaceae bacterium]|jgi:16S rRNA (uracil1498-N3)-methyltransferase